MMTHHFVFELPLALAIGAPLAACLLALETWRLARRGFQKKHVAALAGLRACALAVIVFLAARPVWVSSGADEGARRSVVLLADKSESMSLAEDGRTRYARLLEFTQRALLPALRREQWKIEPYLFS